MTLDASKFCTYTANGRECGAMAVRHEGGALGHDFHAPAQQEGENPTQIRLAQLRAKLVDTAGLDAIPAPVPLIGGVLYRDSLAWLYGRPGSGKSFLALDWAGCVANGLPWQRREVNRGPVLYLAAEGASGLGQRVRAWEQTFNVKMLDVGFLPVAVQLLNGVDLAALLLLVVALKPALVVVDTQARVTVGADENSNGEMGKVVDAADRIRQASDACVLMIHHSGKNGLDMRGASAFQGAATSIIKVTEDSGRWIDVTSDKQKDAPDFEPIRLRMTPAGNSLVLTATGPADDAAISDHQHKILDELRQSFGSNGASASQLLRVTGIAERTFYRELKALVARGAVHQGGTQARPRYCAPEMR